MRFSDFMILLAFLSLLFFLAICFPINQAVSLEEDKRSLEEIVKSNAQISMDNSTKEENKSEIPGYKESDKNQMADELNNIDPNVLAERGANLRNEEMEKNPDGMIATGVAASSSKRLSGFKNYDQLDLFTFADDIMRDPIANMAKITEKECKIIDHDDANKGFKKRERIQKFTENVSELQTCEVPLDKFICQKSLKVSCTRTSECDYGGIERGSVASDMALQINPGLITIGSIRDNEWGGRCDIIDRTTTFRAKNIEKIQEFRIIKVGFDDYLQIKVNGRVVYVGPDGGSKLEVVIGKGWYGQPEKQVFNGINNQACERNTNWVRGVNVDIKPYLVEGNNTIDIRVIVYGWGEGWLQIKAKAQCCAPEDWKEEWEENCEQS
jgi:hypothetical protein